MADTYDDVIPRVAGGMRHTDARWPTWFSQVGGTTLEERIRNVFAVSGRVPTRSQFADAQAAMPPAPEPEPEPVVEAAPPAKPRAARKPRAKKPTTA